jgi:methylated-DNA-[protein]-cysteine S-methyltransferase
MSDQQLKSAILIGKLDSKMTFNQKVWAICARVPKGHVTTYADIAAALGTRAYRAVGNALNRNPYAPAVPCHRVVGSTGALTGFALGIDKKRRMLRDEGVEVQGQRARMDTRVAAAELKRSTR